MHTCAQTLAACGDLQVHLMMHEKIHKHYLCGQALQLMSMKAHNSDFLLSASNSPLMLEPSLRSWGLDLSHEILSMERSLLPLLFALL